MTPGQAFRDTLRERWTARGRCVDMRDYDALPEEDRDDLEASAGAAVIAVIDAADMADLVAAAKSYDHAWRLPSRNWTQVPDDQTARLVEGALLAFKSALASQS